MKRLKLKGLIFKIIIVLLSVSSTLLLFETILRIFGPKYYRFNNASAEYYTNPRDYHIPLREEAGHIIYGLDYNESPEGYRLPDSSTPNRLIPPEMEKDVMILGLGDSFTYGRGVRYEDLYLTKLEKLLNLSKKIGIKNCGKVGMVLFLMILASQL